MIDTNLLLVLDETSTHMAKLPNVEWQREADAIAKEAESLAKANAPEWVRDQIHVRGRVEQDTITFTFGDGPGVLRAHEQPFKGQSVATPEGGVGRKFFTRVIDKHLDTWLARLVRVWTEHVRRRTR